MKRINNSEKNDMRKEYSFNELKGGIRGKYAKRYSKRTNLVLLGPEVSKAFPTEKKCK